jgi:putative transposase
MVVVESEVGQGSYKGIDMGLKHFMTDSHGDVVENPRYFRKSRGKLKKLQQRLAKKKNTRCFHPVLPGRLLA